MSTQDILNIFLLIGFIIFIICVVFTTYYFIQALKAVQSLAENLKDTSESIKEKIQMKALAALPSIIVALIGRVFKKNRG